MNYVCPHIGEPEAYVVNARNKTISMSNKGVVTWHIVNFSDDQPKHKTIHAFHKAFNILSFALFPIRFESTSSPDADISITFCSPEGFEPGVLAYAYYPGSSREGIVKVNDGVTWADMHSEDGRRDLLTVLLHELCHALGVGHSKVKGALMEAIYAGERRELHTDDIDGLNYLYMMKRLDLFGEHYSTKSLKRNLLMRGNVEDKVRPLSPTVSRSSGKFWSILVIAVLCLLAVCAITYLGITLK